MCLGEFVMIIERKINIASIKLGVIVVSSAILLDVCVDKDGALAVLNKIDHQRAVGQKNSGIKIRVKLTCGFKEKLLIMPDAISIQKFVFR